MDGHTTTLARAAMEQPSISHVPSAKPTTAGCASANTAPALSFQIVTSRAGFDALEGEWNTLFERAGRPHQVFQSFNWNWHWANHLLGTLTSKRSLAILTARREGELVMIWPLVAERAHGLTILSWMGEPISQYGDIIADDSIDLGALQAAWKFLCTTLKPDLARLNKTRADAAITPLLDGLGGTITQRLEAPFLDLTSAATFEDYEQRYSTKARKNRRRYWRRIEEQGDVAVRQFHEGPDAAAILDEAITVKRAWLAHKGLVSPALADERTRRFFHDVASSTQRPIACRVSTITCNGVNAAFEVGFACKGHMAIHILAYSLEFEKQSVGVLLLEAMLRASMGAGIKTYDLLAPRADYKMDWADGVVAVNDHALAMTVKGRVYAQGYLALVRPKLKVAVERMPTSIRRLLSRRLSIAVLALSGAA
jgi:CelD/BcsL family acetyltransferase involved in cellulose biosynthesis